MALSEDTRELERKIETASRIASTAQRTSGGVWVVAGPLVLSPEILEPARRQLGVSHRMLDIAMAQVGLQCPRIMALLARAKPQACRSMWGAPFLSRPLITRPRQRAPAPA